MATVKRIQTISNLPLFESKIAPSIHRAMEGEAYYHRCHPDYILPLDSEAYVGTFPHNIAKAYWVRAGFKDSWLPNSEFSEILEVHGILELNHGHYVVFDYLADNGEGFPVLNGAVTTSYEIILGALSGSLRKKYEQETEPIEWGGEEAPVLPRALDFSFGAMSPIRSRSSPGFLEPLPSYRSRIMNPEDCDWDEDADDEEEEGPRKMVSHRNTASLPRPTPVTPPSSPRLSGPPPVERKIRAQSFA